MSSISKSPAPSDLKIVALPELLHKAGLSYIQEADGYGNGGDCVYETDRDGWWDCYFTGFFKGPIPKKWEQFIQHIDENERQKVQQWFEKFPITVIVCSTYACNGAGPMVRFYYCNKCPFYVEDIVTDREKLDHSFHLFWVQRNEQDLNQSDLFCCNWKLDKNLFQ